MATQEMSGRGPIRTAQVGLFLAGEAGWLFAWSAALGGWLDLGEHDPLGPLLGWPTILGFLAVATLATRVSLAGPRSARLARAAVALVGLAAAIVVGAAAVWATYQPLGWPGWNETWSSFSRDIVGLRGVGAMALGLLAWWRGIAVGRKRLTLDVAEAGFRRAVFALAGLYLVDTLALPSETAWSGEKTLLALLALFAGLIGMPLARVLDEGEDRRRREGPRLRVDRHWLSMLLGVVVGLLALTLLLAHLLTAQRLDTLVQPLLRLVAVLLEMVIYVIALPLGLLAEALIRLIRPPRGTSEPHAGPALPDLDWLRDIQEQSTRGHPPEMLLAALKWALIAALAALVVWLLARAVFRLADRGQTDDVEEVRDFVWGWAELQAAIAGWLRALIRRRPWSITPAGQPTAVATGPDVPCPDRGARELYRELLRLGARLGHRRALDQTPDEYERTLGEIGALAAGRDELRLLTDVYTRARYGAEPPTAAAIAAARAALEKLECRHHR
ncbi:MAG: DUF4129 domain-containing protein [Chloroflexi bacterium]|nr:DUF4129 domain-containing protein [Chloroflexota bacterium]